MPLPALTEKSSDSPGTATRLMTEFDRHYLPGLDPVTVAMLNERPELIEKSLLLGIKEQRSDRTFVDQLYKYLLEETKSNLNTARAANYTRLAEYAAKFCQVEPYTQKFTDLVAYGNRAIPVAAVTALEGHPTLPAPVEKQLQSMLLTLSAPDEAARAEFNAIHEAAAKVLRRPDMTPEKMKIILDAARSSSRLRHQTMQWLLQVEREPYAEQFDRFAREAISCGERSTATDSTFSYLKKYPTKENLAVLFEALQGKYGDALVYGARETLCEIGTVETVAAVHRATPRLEYCGADIGIVRSVRQVFHGISECFRKAEGRDLRDLIHYAKDLMPHDLIEPTFRALIKSADPAVFKFIAQQQPSLLDRILDRGYRFYIIKELLRRSDNPQAKELLQRNQSI